LHVYFALSFRLPYCHVQYTFTLESHMAHGDTSQRATISERYNKRIFL